MVKPYLRPPGGAANSALRSPSDETEGQSHRRELIVCYWANLEQTVLENTIALRHILANSLQET
jgi:hypothetical protein